MKEGDKTFNPVLTALKQLNFCLCEYRGKMMFIGGLLGAKWVHQEIGGATKACARASFPDLRDGAVCLFGVMTDYCELVMKNACLLRGLRGPSAMGRIHAGYSKLSGIVGGVIYAETYCRTSGTVKHEGGLQNLPVKRRVGIPSALPGHSVLATNEATINIAS